MQPFTLNVYTSFSPLLCSLNTKRQLESFPIVCSVIFLSPHHLLQKSEVLSAVLMFSTSCYLFCRSTKNTTSFFNGSPLPISQIQPSSLVFQGQKLFLTIPPLTCSLQLKPFPQFHNISNIFFCLHFIHHCCLQSQFHSSTYNGL